MTENSFRKHICKKLYREPDVLSMQAADEIAYLETQRDELCRVVAGLCDAFERGGRISAVYDMGTSLAHTQAVVNEARCGHFGPICHRDSAQKPMVCDQRPDHIRSELRRTG